MAKTQATTTLPPEIFATSQGAYYEDVQDVAEMQNAASFWSLKSVWVDQVSSVAAWGSSGNEIATHEIDFPASSGYTTRYTFRIWIDPDVDSLTCRSTCIFPAANTGRVRITVGAANVVLTHTAAATTTDTDTIATSSSGTGIQTVTVEIDHQTGSSTSCYLLSWGVRCDPVVSSLPDPVE